MNEYDNKEILTKQEQLVNVIYYIFRYILYSCGFYVIEDVFGEFAALIAMCIFVYLSFSYQASKGKIQQEIIIRERRDAFRKARDNIDDEDDIDIF